MVISHIMWCGVVWSVYVCVCVCVCVETRTNLPEAGLELLIFLLLKPKYLECQYISPHLCTLNHFLDIWS
jgi:hypothetical protein